MFGFVKANLSELTPEERDRYRAVYCGLCHTLGSRYGFRARLSLNYDLTFLAMLLSSLYEPEEVQGKSRCILHRYRKRAYVTNSCIEYAADMTVALMYFKCIDDWEDERKLPQKCYASLLSKAYEAVKATRPEQCATIEKELNIIAEIEDRRESSPDAASNSFGRLMAGIFVMEPDHWTPHLQRFGYNLGKYIYLADAAVDLCHDAETGDYNPLTHLAKKPEDVRPILKMILGEASEEFEALPLVQDADIMRNILYSGIWIKYNDAIRKDREGESDGQ